MGSKRKKSPTSPSSSFSPPNEEPIANRVAKLGNEDLMMSVELQLNSLVRYVPEYQRSRNPDCLGEAMLATEALYVMLDELLKRQSRVEDVVSHARQNRWQ